MNEKDVEKTLCSPERAALLAFATTILGILVVPQLKESIVDDATSMLANFWIALFLAAIVSLLTYVISRAAEKYHDGPSCEDEKEMLYGAVISASMHYLGNSIASFQLIELEIEACGTVSKESLEKISEMLSETKYNLKCMSEMEKPSAQKIHDYIRRDLNIG